MGREGKKTSARVREDKATVHKMGKVAAGMSLTATASSQEDNDEAHHKLVVPYKLQSAGQIVDNTTADVVNPNATCTRPKTPVDRSPLVPDSQDFPDHLGGICCRVQSSSEVKPSRDGSPIVLAYYFPTLSTIHLPSSPTAWLGFLTFPTIHLSSICHFPEQIWLF
jgi:hypothetical protein